MTEMVTDTVRSTTDADQLPQFAIGAVITVGAAAGAVMIWAATQYGYNYDELYFLAAGEHLSIGYADQGPILPFLARAMDTLFPGSYAALRIPSIILTLVGLLFSAALAREFGGGRAAQTLTAASYATSLSLLGGAALATNAIDIPLWVVITWLVVRWVRTRDDRLLFIAGAVTAIDLEIKLLVPVLWIAIAISALWLGPRDLPRRPALWAGAALSVLVTAPTLIWQAQHGWPQLAMAGVIRSEMGFIGGTVVNIPLAILLNGLLGATLLIYGTWRLCRSPRLRPYRFLGVAFLIILIAFALGGGHAYYAAGIFPLVMAVGATELTALPRRWPLITTIPVGILSAAALSFFAATPWTAVAQLQPASEAKAAATTPFGEYGWAELTTATANIYRALPTIDRDNTVVVAETYPQASALDREHTAAALPSVYSPHRGYAYFGTPPETTTTVLWIGGKEEDLRTWFATVTPAVKTDVPLGIPDLTKNVTIWECHDPTQPWSLLWPKMHKL